MARSKSVFPADWSVGDLLNHLARPAGAHPPLPAPGRATERHVIALDAHEDRLFELIDRVLVEKTSGFAEAYVSTQIGANIGNFADAHDLGVVSGGSGSFRFGSGQVRIPDAAFISWDRLPGKTVPAEAIPDLAPDLAVEVLSAGNTQQEMERKLKDYFSAGVRLVWYVNVKKRTAEVYTSPDQGTTADRGTGARRRRGAAGLPAAAARAVRAVGAAGRREAE